MEQFKNNKKDSIELNIIHPLDGNFNAIELSNNKNLYLLDNNEQNKENDQIIKIDKNNSNKLYGNYFMNKTPKKLGNMRAYCYYKDSPLIIIGPECKYIVFLF